MTAIRSSLGVCPQHDVLFADLTVRIHTMLATLYACHRHLTPHPSHTQVEEHLSIFAAFKGVPAKDIPAAVDEMVREVGLTEKRKTASKNLSGGYVLSP